MARLILINAPDRPTYDIAEDVFSIGRTPENQLTLADALVSRRHAEIRLVGTHYRIVDLGSLNGVYVNNLKISDEQLTHGDVILMGESKLLFESELPKKEAAPAPSGSELSLPPPAFSSGAPIGLGSPEIVKPLEQAGPEYELEVMSLSSLRGQSQSAPNRLEPARSRNFFILYQVARALNSTNSLTELLDQTMTLIFQVISAERGVIFLYNEDGALEPRITKSRKDGEPPELGVSKTITTRAVQEKAAIITADAKYDPRFQSGASIVAYNIRSAICVPLWTRGRIRGAIYLDNLLETYAFGEDDLDLLTAIANQVAIAVEHEEMQARMREAAVFRANLERFHSPEVANLIMQQSRLEHGFKKFLEEREVTVIFADISKFTPLMEQLSVAEAGDLINEYFEEMTGIIFKNQGTVDKFIGDAIMAIFGAPITHGNDSYLAVNTAVEMMRRLEGFKASREKRKRFDIRIGINTGRVVAGYIGSQSRVDYSVLGDPVNVAARLQALASPGTILVGEKTYLETQDSFSFKDRGTTRLKGKTEETRFYEVIF